MDLNKTLGSGIRIKIVRFFHENQSSIDTPRGVAAWIGEDRMVVKKTLEYLVSCDILVADRSTSTTGYSYTRDARLISSIGKLLKKKST